MQQENIMQNLEEISTKDLKIGSLEWEKAWNHNRKVTRIKKGMTLKKFGEFLSDRGYTHVTVEYEGSGDSGECYYAEGFKSYEEFNNRGDKWGCGERIGGYCGSEIEKGTHNQKELLELFNTYKEYNPLAEFGKQDSENLHWVLTSIINYDWYNNEGGQGEVVWYLKKGTIEVNGYQNYRGEYECKETYNVNGKEPKTKYKDIG